MQIKRFSLLTVPIRKWSNLKCFCTLEIIKLSCLNALSVSSIWIMLHSPPLLENISRRMKKQGSLKAPLSMSFLNLLFSISTPTVNIKFAIPSSLPLLLKEDCKGYGFATFFEKKVAPKNFQREVFSAHFSLDDCEHNVRTAPKEQILVKLF